MGFEIIQISEGGFEIAYEIIVDCGKDMKEKQGLGHWYPPEPKEKLFYEFAHNQVYLVKNHDNGHFVGTFTIEFRKDGGSSALIVSKLAVLPSYQNKGIGTLCMERAFKIASRNNFYSIILDVYIKNSKALRFYLCKLDYRMISTKNVIDSHDPSKQWALVTLEKELKNISKEGAL